MPIFEFTCRKCGHRFEEILSHADVQAGTPVCTACGSKRTQREMSSFAMGGAGTASGELPCGQPPGSCGGGGGFT